MQYTAPVKRRQEQPQPAPVKEKPAAKPQKEAAATAAKPLYRHKGGRAIAVVVLILLLLFAFLVLTPYYRVGDEGIMMGEDDKPLTIRFGFLAKFDKGLIFQGEGESIYPYYGVDLIQPLISVVKGTSETEASALELLQAGFGTGGLAIVAMVALFVLVAFVQLIVCIIRIIRGKRSIHANYFYLVLASLTLLWSLLAFFLQKFVDPDGTGFLVTLRTIFVPGANGMVEFGVGYVLFLIPLFFGILFFFSLFGKARKVKEKVA